MTNTRVATRNRPLTWILTRRDAISRRVKFFDEPRKKWRKRSATRTVKNTCDDYRVDFHCRSTISRFLSKRREWEANGDITDFSLGTNQGIEPGFFFRSRASGAM
jgi:hypothetical protein